MRSTTAGQADSTPLPPQRPGTICWDDNEQGITVIYELIAAFKAQEHVGPPTPPMQPVLHGASSLAFEACAVE